jgi:hypothetical protein
LHIDSDWWDSLTPYIQSLIKSRVSGNIVFTRVEIPHTLNSANTPNLLAIYYSYIEGFDYNIWYHPEIENGPKNVKLISLSSSLKESLAKITRRKILMRSEFNESEKEDIAELKQEIQTCLDAYQKLGILSVFARLSGTSGKNEVALEPLDSAEKVLSFMTENRLFLNQEYTADKESYLILMPWNFSMDERYEFRIFVKDGRLTGISQQKWFQLYQYSDEELSQLVKAFQDLRFLKDLHFLQMPKNQLFYQRIAPDKSLHFLPEAKTQPFYRRYAPDKNLHFFPNEKSMTFVGDVYVNIEEGVCYLIECNPFGAHCGAGSALFHWIKDKDQLEGKSGKAEFRYLSIII